MRYLSIKNFPKYQHYKDRRPPWIKLHVEVLDDYHFLCLQDASKAHLMLLWVLASKLDNRIPYDLVFLSKKLGTTSPIDVEELVLQGFVELSQDDSKPLAGRKQSAIVETEAEAEAKTEKKKASASDEAAPKASGLELLPKVDCDTLYELWSARRGAVAYSRFRKAILTVYQSAAGKRYTTKNLADAIAAYAEWVAEQPDREQGFCTLERFISEVAKWVKYGAMPLTQGGEMTERGRWAGSRELREQSAKRPA